MKDTASRALPAPPIAQQRLDPGSWVILVVLAVVWGGSFTANRGALSEVGVMTTVGFRVLGGAALLWVVVWLRGIPVDRDRRTVGALFIMGVLNNVIPFCLIVWGQSHIPSGLASILNATTAIFTVMLAPLFFADERLTLVRVTGLLVGISGVAVMVGLEVLGGLDPASLGQMAVLGATLSYAAAGIFARKALKGLPPEVSAAGMLSAAATVVVPLALFAEGTPSFDYSAGVWFALAYLAFGASALAYMFYFILLRRAGAGNLSLVTLLIPPVSIVLGKLLFAERLDATAYAGFILLAAGLMILDGRLSPSQWRKPAESA